MQKLRSYAFWKFRSYASTANFPREPSDRTLPGNLDLIPFWQNLNNSQEFSKGNLRSDAFRDNQPCSGLFQSCFSLKQSCFRAVQGWSKFVTFWSEIVKKTLINTTLLYFQSTFYSKPYISAFFTILRVTYDQEAWGRGGCVNSNFWLEFRRNDFFIAGTLQRNMFFVIPIPFRTYTKHFRRFLDSFWSSAEQRWFRGNQRWTALKQRWSALVFLTHSETALISAEIYKISETALFSAEIYKISETALFSADLFWDFKTGSNLLIQFRVEWTFLLSSGSNYLRSIWFDAKF